jgi:hypothetical protein
MATTATPASTPAEKAAATRKKNAVKRSTTAKKAAATRRQTTAAKQAAEAKQDIIKNPVKRAGAMAEKAVLVPVGAALVAREGVASTIEELRASYSTRKKTESELRRFERRGTTAVKRVEREMRSMMKGIESRTEPVTKNVELVTARVENAVASGRNAAAKVQERITARA